MTLTPGTRLGPYEIVAPLGAGGMGEVYRARDTRLGRDVAVKVLPHHLSADAEVRARFEREARAVSSLNHPHICTLFDVGRQGETDYLVMELVEGESLAERLARGPLPIADVLRLGAQIADALDRAHRAGIVHRDLKPGNVMLSKSGAKLMDFGLARAAVPAGTSSSRSSLGETHTPTRTAPLTGEGRVVGTFQYMAPEQLEGRDADARSDVWSLGATLYEMATGQRAFSGETSASLISAIMRDEPRPLVELTPASPRALDEVIRGCMAKDPDERWQSAGDVRRLLRALDPSTSGGGTAVTAPRRRAKALLPWVLAAILPVAAFALARLLAPAKPTQTPTRVTLELSGGGFYHVSGDFAGPPMISPDGARIAFVALAADRGTSIWVRELDSFVSRPVPGTEGGSFPFWSPDGRSLAFWAAARLKRVDLDGGAVVSLCEANAMRGGSWGEDGRIVFTPDVQSGLWTLPASGGRPRALTIRDTTYETTHRFPQILPGGRWILYFGADHRDPRRAESGIWVASADGKQRRKVADSPTSGVYADGFLLFLQDTVLMAQRFEARTGRTQGVASPTNDRVQPDLSTWTSNLSASRTGRLLYVKTSDAYGSHLEERSRDGTVLRALSGHANHTSVYLSKHSPMLVEGAQEIASADLWAIDLTSGRRRRVLSTLRDEDNPVLSPDGGRLAFAANRGADRYSVYVMRADGADSPRLMAEGSGDLFPVDWSPDGRHIIVMRGAFLVGSWDTLFAVPASGADPPVRLIASNDQWGDARLSPDGRWLAYSNGPFGEAHIFVTAFQPGWPAGSAPEGRWQVGQLSGMFPRWSKAGREIVYLRLDGTIVAVEIAATGSAVSTGAEQVLFRAPTRPYTAAYDVSADGQRFYLNVLSAGENARLGLVTNWREGLRKPRH